MYAATLNNIFQIFQNNDEKRKNNIIATNQISVS